MKRRYALHPMEFAIGETEQFYSEMAAKGWFLEKRGGWFSRFRCPGRLHRIYMRPCSSRNRCRAGDLWHGAPGEFPVLR